MSKNWALRSFLTDNKKQQTPRDDLIRNLPLSQIYHTFPTVLAEKEESLRGKTEVEYILGANFVLYLFQVPQAQVAQEGKEMCNELDRQLDFLTGLESTGLYS